MSKYTQNKKMCKGLAGLQRMVKFCLASGMIAMPWVGFAADITTTSIVRTDGATGDTTAGNIHTVYAGKSLSSTVGASTFSKFDVKSGDIANMHFRTAAGQENFNTLLNFVDSKININGTVNAIRNSQIGGHLYFLSPNGMAVGANGAINAGSLTVMTPTQKWWEDRCNTSAQSGKPFDISKFTASDLENVQNLAVPINQSGSICILGKVNAVDNINLKAGVINIGTDGAGENAVTAKALLKAGVNDFSAVVNTSQLPTGVAYQNLTVSDDGGNIEIVAEAKTPEDLTSLLISGMGAGVNVAGGSEVNAKGNLTVTATAESTLKITSYKKEKTEDGKTEKVQYVKVNNEEMTLADFEKKYKGLSTYGMTLGGVTVVGANINVAGSDTVLTGNNVSIKATATNTYANNAETRSVGANENIGNLIGETLFNALDISFAKMTTVAGVNLGANTIVNATGADTGVTNANGQVLGVIPALQIAANATTKLTLGTNPTTWETAGAVWMPGVGAIFGNVNNTASINVAGTLKSEGSANLISTGDVTAELTATMGKSTTKDAASAVSTATLFNLGLVGLEGSNSSTITLTDTANLREYLKGDFVAKALANNSLTSTNEVVGSDGTTAIFGVSWFKYNSNATINVATNVIAEGNVTLQAESTYTDNEMQLESQSGSTSEKEGKEAAKAMSEAKAKSVKELLESFYKTNFSQDSKVGKKVMGWVTEKAKKYDLWKTSSGEDSSFAKTLSEKISAGVTFGYMEETNSANITLKQGTKVEAKGDMGINAYSHYEDTVLNVQGSSTNAYAQTTSGSALVANGAIMLANLENTAEVSVVGATVNAGGNLNLDAQAAFEYNRVERMVEAIDDLLVVVVKALAGAELTDVEKKELKEGTEAFQEVVTAFKEDLKDNETFQKTIKESKDGYKKLTNKIKSFTENKTVKSFLTSDLVKGLGTRIKTAGTAVEAIVGKATDFLQPANYLNFSVGNTTTSGSESASQSSLALGITTGITNLDNTGTVSLSKDSVLQATGGTSSINLQATGSSSDVALDGHLGFDSAATGASGANVVMSVGVHNANNNSKVLLNDTAQLSANAIGLNSNTDTLHIGFGANKVEAGSSNSTSWAGVVNYVGGESNNTLTLDSNTQLTGNVVTLGTVNATTVVDVTGSLATEGKASGSVGIGIILLDRDNICTVKGNIIAQTLTVETLTKGNIVNVAADVAFSKAVADKQKSKEEKSKEEASDAAKDTGEVAGALLDEEAEKAEDGTEEAESTEAVKVAKDDDVLPKATNESSSSDKGAALPSFNLSAAASVAVTDLDATTTTLLDGATITLSGGSNTSVTTATDNSVLVTVAGGAALLKSSSNSGGISDSTASQIAISGAAAVNLAKSNTSTEIKNSTISGATNITNEANRNGALVAAGAAVNLTLSGKNSKNVSVGADCSVNIGNYTTTALLKDSTIGGTDLTNRAQDSDLQVAGGIQANIITGGTSSVGVGATVTWDILHNDVEARIDGGTYTEMGVVLNEATTGLTQVTAALSLGVSSAGGAVVEGSVVVGYLDNQTTADLDGITLDGVNLTSQAYDKVLANQHAEELSTDLGIDTEGKNEKSEEYTSAISTELAPASDATNEEKYVDNTALQVTKQGNKMVTAAVQISGSSKAKASVGAAVVVNQYDNDFTSTVSGSNITLTGSDAAKIGAETKSTIVGVAAGGNGTSKGFAGGGSVVIGDLDNTTTVTVKDSALKVSDSANVEIKAINNEKVVNVAGAVSVGKLAVGLDVVYNSMNTLTGAYLQNSNVSGNSLNLDAENNASVYGVAVGVTASSNAGINGSVAVNVGKNSVTAVAESKNKENTLSLSEFTVHSSDDSTLIAAAGGLSVGSKIALGGALAWNELKTTGSDSQYNLASVSGYTVDLSKEGKAIIEATDTAKLTTVGLGVGLTNKNVAVQGADATAKITKQTSALMQDVTVNNSDNLQGTVSVKAKTDNTMTTVGAVVVGSLKYVALGAGTTQNFLTADTLAQVSGGSINLAGLDVNATSTEKVKNVAVGVAASKNLALGGSVVVNTLDNDTSAVLGNGEDKLTVNSAGAVNVEADSKEDLFNLSGQISATIGSGASISGGFAVAVDTIKGNTEALAKNVDVRAKGLTVLADANHILKTIPFVGTAGISTEAIAIGAGAVVGITNISGNTLAEASSMDYNKDTDSASGDVVVKANDDMNSNTVITSVEVGISPVIAAALGAGVDKNYNTRNVEAKLTNGTVNADKVKVTADSDVTLKVTNTAINAGASEQVAVDVTGNVSYIKLDETTNALVDNIISENNGLTVTADHKDDITLYGTSVTVSASEKLSVAIQVGINSVKNTATTTAELANSRITHYENKTATDKVEAKNDATVKMYEKAFNVAIALVGVGAGVLVGNSTLEQAAIARVYKTTIGTDSVQADNFSVISDNTLSSNFDRFQLGAGTVAIGVGVNLNKVDTTSKVELDQVDAYADTITVTAKDNKIVNGKMVSISMAGIPIGVSSMHTYVGTAVADETYDGEDVEGFKKYVSTGNPPESEEQIAEKQKARNEEFAKYSENDFDADRVEKDTESALNKVNNEILDGEYGLIKQTKQETISDAKFTDSDKKNTYDAQKLGNVVNIQQTNLYGYGNVAIGAESIINTDTQVLGGEAGVIAVQVEVNKQRVKEKVAVKVKGSTIESETGNVTIEANGSGTLKNTASGITVAGVGISYTLVETIKEGDGVAITLGSENSADKVSLKAAGDLLLVANDTLGINNTLNMVAVGGAAIAVTLSRATDSANNIINLAGANSLTGGNSVTVMANSVPQINTEVGTVAVGAIAGAGLVSTAQTKGQVVLNVDDGNSFVSPTVNLMANIWSPEGKDAYNLKSDISSVGVSVVGIGTSESRTYTEKHLTLSVGDIEVGTDNDLLVDLTIGVIDRMSLYNDIGSVKVGVLSCDANCARSKLNDKLTVTVGSDEGISDETGSLTVYAMNCSTVSDKARSTSVALTSSNPFAGRVESEVISSNELTLVGEYQAQNIQVGSMLSPDMNLMVDTSEVSLYGSACAGGDNTVNLTNTITLSKATLKAEKAITLEGNVTPGLNKNVTSDNDNVLMFGNGGGAVNFNSSAFVNKVDIANNLRIDSSKLLSQGTIDLLATVGGTMNSVLSSYKAVGIFVDADCVYLDNSINTANLITLQGDSHLETSNYEKDITLAAWDKLNVTASTYSEMSATIGAQVTNAKTVNKLTRSNRLDLQSGSILSRGNVNLYAQRDSNGNTGELYLRARAETYNGGIIPVTTPTLENTLIQKNQVDVGKDMNINSILDVNLYADTGFESVSLLEARHSLYRNKTNVDYVVSANGGLEDCDATYDDYVRVEGNIVAGVGSNQSITLGSTEKRVVVVSSAEEKAALIKDDNDLVYTVEEFVNLTEDTGITVVADSVLGLTKDQIKVSVVDYKNALTERYAELQQLISDRAANGTTDKIYIAYQSELDRIESQLSKLNMYSSEKDAYYVVAATIPNLVGSGGNVNVESRTLYGEGKVTARGEAEISIKNYTNLMLYVNDAIIYEKGGELLFNDQSISGTDEEKQQQIKGINKNAQAEVKLDVAVAATSQDPVIDIHGYYDGKELKYVDEEGSTSATKACANLEINGDISNTDGLINIVSDNNSIIEEGITAKDNASLKGKKVNVVATKGSICVGFSEGVYSVGSVESQYKDYFEILAGLLKEAGDGTTLVKSFQEAQASEKVSADVGIRVVGDEIYICAEDININGVIQSGYGKYYASLKENDTELAANIAKIEDENAGRTLTDAQVTGNSQYKVYGGTYVQNDDGYYDYQVAVYYNPSTDTLLTEDVSGKGGMISLTGRIISTGSTINGSGAGSIYCLDGAYDIDIDNELNYDLKLGDLLVNEVSGMVKITNIDSGMVIQYTSSGIQMLKEGKVISDISTKTGTKGYDYNIYPETGLRYNWSEGYKDVGYQTYSKTTMAKWWGGATAKEIATENETVWKNDPQVIKEGDYVPESQVSRPTGITASTSSVFSSDQQIGVVHDVVVVEEKSGNVTFMEPEYWSTGFFGCHKWTKYTWRWEKGKYTSDTISIKADNPIGIKFIGTTAEQAQVNVTSTAVDKKVTISGNIGNTKAYTSENSSLVTEKGLVNINAVNGSISQTDDAIYGSDVTLSAKNDIKNINLVNGNTMNLAAELTGKGSISITAKDQAQVVQGSSTLNVVKLTGEGTDADVEHITLVGDGNLIQVAGQVSKADRIDLTSNYGSVLGVNNGNFCVNVSQQPINIDSLSASLNISANGDIKVEQTEEYLRVGKIYSAAGDVTITVANGGLVDALSYSNITTDEEKDLIEQWKRMGLIAGGDNDMVAKKQKAEENAANMEGRDVNNYELWSQDALLYNLEDSIINPQAGTTLSTKDPNIYANNITINAKSSVGLNSDDVQVINLSQMTMDELKILSKADAGTVEMSKDSEGNQIATVTKKLALGLQQGSEQGQIIINSSEGNVYLETRKDNSGTLSNTDLNLQIGSINAVAGNVRLTSAGDIFGCNEQSLIVGRDVFVSAGLKGTNDGNIGSASQYLQLDMSGNLTALATGNIYLAQATVGGVTKDWYIATMNAGEVNGEYSSTSGNIYLTSQGNIYGYYNSGSTLQGYIYTNNHGNISINAGGNIGYYENDGVVDTTKTLRLKNTAEESTDASKGDTVSLVAGEGINVEGVSTLTGSQSTEDGVAPSGFLNVANVVAGAHKLQFTVNGNLQLPEVSFQDANGNLDGVLTLQVVNFNADNNITAADVDITAAYGFKQETGTVRTNNLDIKAGEKFAITNGKVVWDEEKLQEANVTQVVSANKVTALIVENLQVAATGNIDLASETNQLDTISLDAGGDVSLAVTARTEQLLKLANQNQVITLNVTNTHDNNQHTFKFNDNTETKDQVIGGRVEVYVHNSATGETPDLQINGDLKAAGDIIVFNESGGVTLPDDKEVYADGSILVCSGGSMVSSTSWKSTGGIALVSENNLDINAALIKSNEGLYLRSFNGNVVDTNEDKTIVSTINGDVTLIADVGDVELDRSYYVTNGDITIRAEKSIENYCAQGLYAVDGDIIIYTTGDDSTGKLEGWLINEAPLTAEKGNVYIYAYNGVLNNVTIDAKAQDVTIFSNGIVINGDEDVNKEYIHGKNGVNIMAQGYLSNTATIWAEKGDILLGGIYDDSTAGSTWAASHGAVSNSGTLYISEKGNISVVTTKTLDNTGSIYTNQGSVTVAADDSLENNGGFIYTKAGDVDVSSKKDLTNTNDIYTLTGEVVITSGGTLTNSDSIYTGNGSVKITSGDTLTNTAGEIYAENGDVYLVAENKLENKSSIYTEDGDVLLQSNSGDLVNYDDLSKTGTEATGKNITLMAANGNIDNHSSIYAKEGIVFQGKNVTNEGIISAGKAVSVTGTGDISSNGNISAGEDCAVTGSTIAVTGDISAQKVVMTANGGTLNMDGEITSQDDVTFSSYGQLTNVKKITSSSGFIEMSSNAGLENTGALKAAKSILLGGNGDISNEGSLTADEQIIILAQTNITNKGDIKTQDQVTLVALGGTLTNQGSIQATEDVILYGYKGIVNGNKITSENSDITLIALDSDANLQNSGNLSAGGDIALISLDGNVDNTSDSGTLQGEKKIVAGGNITIKAEKGYIVNDKNIQAEGNIVIKSLGNINYTEALGNINHTEDDAFSIQSTGGDIDISSTGTEFMGGFIFNWAGITADEGNVKLYAQKSVYNESKIVAGTKVSITAAGWIYNRNTIDAGLGITLNGEKGIENGKDTANANDVVYAKSTNGSINLTTENGTVTNNAHLISEAGDINVTAYEDIDSYGSIVAGNGCVKLVAQTGDLQNSDTFGGSDITYAQGSIWLEATEGTITTSPAIMADNDITVIGKKAINITGPEKNIMSTGTGDVVIYATGTGEGEGIINNSSTISTNSGSIYIVANGSQKVTVEGKESMLRDVSIMNDDTGDIIANGGDVVLYAKSGVANEGDIKAIQNGNEEAGNISITSEEGGIMLMNKEVQGAGNTFSAEGGLQLYAPNDILYNEKDFEANDDIQLIFGGSGGEISINNNITSYAGSIVVATEKEGATLILLSGKNISAAGSAIFHSEGGALVVGNITAGVDINVGAVGDAFVGGVLKASDGSVLIGTETGNMEVSGSLKGERVALYTENTGGNIKVDLNNLQVTKELILACNHWDAGDMSKISTDYDGYDLRLFGAGGTNAGGNYDLNFGNMTDTVKISVAAVETLKISTNGRVTIDNLAVSDIAEISTMGTKTDVYGKAQAYDGDAKVIYYASGEGAASIDMHKMFFDGGSNIQQYQDEMDILWAKGSDAFIQGGANSDGKGMMLDIWSASAQRGNGLLLKNYYGQKTYRQRFSLEQLAQHLLKFDSMKAYNDYFHVGNIDFYQSWNLLDIPDVTVNSSEKTEKELYWEF